MSLKISNAALRYRPPDSRLRIEGEALRRARARSAGSVRDRASGERRTERTVYVLPAAVQPKPVQIKTGISDGVFTEVVEGLKEGDRVVTARSVARGNYAGGDKSVCRRAAAILAARD